MKAQRESCTYRSVTWTHSTYMGLVGARSLIQTRPCSYIVLMDYGLWGGETSAGVKSAHVSDRVNAGPYRLHKAKLADQKQTY